MPEQRPARRAAALGVVATLLVCGLAALLGSSSHGPNSAVGLHRIPMRLPSLAALQPGELPVEAVKTTRDAATATKRDLLEKIRRSLSAISDIQDNLRTERANLEAAIASDAASPSSAAAVTPIPPAPVPPSPPADVPAGGVPAGGMPPSPSASGTYWKWVNGAWRWSAVWEVGVWSWDGSKWVWTEGRWHPAGWHTLGPTSDAPTHVPTELPSTGPTPPPSKQPSHAPTTAPSVPPTTASPHTPRPSATPSDTPSETARPSSLPTTAQPSSPPTSASPRTPHPSYDPSAEPTARPSADSTDWLLKKAENLMTSSPAMTCAACRCACNVHASCNVRHATSSIPHTNIQQINTLPAQHLIYNIQQNNTLPAGRQ